jgi:amino acid adenylation domain-containing protein
MMPETVFPGNEKLKPGKDYRENTLQGATPLNLPVDFPRQAAKNITGNRSVTASIDRDLYEQLIQLSNTQNVNLDALLLSVFEVLLYRYSESEDVLLWIVLPTISGNRLYSTLPLRNFVNGNQIFTKLLADISANVEEIAQYNSPDRSINATIPANLVFNYRKIDSSLVLEPASGFEIELTANDSGSSLELNFEYDANLFKETTVNRMLAHYQRLLQAVIDNPQQSIGSLPMLSAEEWNDIVVKFNNTLTTYASEKTIQKLFEEQAARTPDAIALRQHDHTMTYGELNKKANRLARHLVEKGIQPGDNIGLIATRGFDMIVGMYGIMKAGGAYVPIDPEYPLERQEYILRNSLVTGVVADGDYALEQSIATGQFFKLGTLDLSKPDEGNLNLDIDSKQLAYTIYTSGSTGRPKGVMIEHHSVVNLVQWVNKTFNIGADDRLLFITSMCFDLSVYDIFGMMAAGGSIVIVKQDELMDVPKLKDMMLEYKITFWDSVPTTMDYLARELESQDNGYIQGSLRLVFMSGDWIPVSLPGRINKFFPNANVISLGGATEGTIWSNYYAIEKVGSDWSSIPYGRPIDNNFFYILNEQLQPVPVGVPGELYIGGMGVARGYANDPEKTNYSFIKNPFNDQAGGRIYRTGDLGRMLPNMNMEFIGRKDNQVKIRGFRIELGEIESVLKQSEHIHEAVVLARDDKENKKRLVSYVVPKKDYDREVAISLLRNKLPDYMIPSLWLELDKLPLTSNGKVDKKALPDFEAEEQLKDNYIAPRTESEKLLSDIWKQVLKLKKIGIDDNFFDIGGHSLLAVQIMSRIEKRTGKKFPIATLFRFPSIASLGAFLDEEEEKEHKWRSLVPIKAEGNKTPLYVVHGIGLNVLNFNDLALHVDKDQPVFGFQGLGLDGEEAQTDSIEQIASIYVSELIRHNPKGPYAIAGYSIGGFIAVEMARQLIAMGREIKMLGIFDTDAENARENEAWYVIMPKVVKRYLPRFMGGKKSLRKQLVYVFKTRTEAIGDKVGISKKLESKEYYVLLNKIIKQYINALDNYRMQPVAAEVYLYKANINVHYNDDKDYLGWRKYAEKGVRLLDVPGDHLDMLKPPHVAKLGSVLQKALDNG